MSKQTILASAANITSNYLPRYNGTGYVDSVLYDNGTNIGIGTTSPNIGGYGANSRLLTVQGVSGSYGILELTSNSANADGSAIGRLDFGSNGQAANYKAISSIASFLSGSTSTKFGADLRFYTRADNAASGDPSERMRISTTGNVGIGTNSPAARLDVRIASEAVGSGAVSLIAGTSNGANDIFRWFDGTTQLGVIKNNGFVGIGINNPAERLDVFTGRVKMGDGGGFELNFNTPTFAAFQLNGTERMRITSGGNVGINTSSPSTYLEVSNGGTNNNAYITTRNSGVAGYRSGAVFINQGTGGLSWYLVSTNNSDGDWGGGKFSISTNNATGVYLNGSTATSWTGQSDIRLKDVDSEIEDALNKVNQLRGVRFTWKSDETKKMQVGLIAQEVKEVLPEAVDFDDTNEDYKMGVQYTDLIPLLVNAIKELSAKVTDQQEQINQLINK